MRILQAPIDISGQATLTARGLRELGHDAQSFAQRDAWAQQPDLWLEGNSRLHRMVNLARFVLRATKHYDVIHYHYAQSLLPDRASYFDAKLARRRGKRVVTEFWGSDIRLVAREKARNPYYHSVEVGPDSVRERKLDLWAGVTSGEVVIPDYYFHVYVHDRFPTIRRVRQRIDTRELEPNFPRADEKRPLVVHAPSHRAFKGSDFIDAAVANLKSKGLDFEYREIHRMPQREAFAIYQQADIIIDQLCNGSHGVFAVEAMAMGKPILCHIVPELQGTFEPGFPLINANPDTIESVLEEWIQRPEDRRKLGEQSREYAERVHDIRVVGKQLLDIYALPSPSGP